MKKLKSGMIGLIIYSNLLLAGCTTSLITLQVESPDQPTQKKVKKQPSVCIVSINQDSTETLEQPASETHEDSDQPIDTMPTLSPIDEENAKDHEYIINRLLDYIDELQIYILEKS